MKINKSLTISLIVAVLLLVGLILVFQISKTPKVDKPKPSSTPTKETAFLTKKAQSIKEELTKTDKKVGDLLLEENDKFKVTYLISNDQFIVTIKVDPFADNKKVAEQWFLSKGFKQIDLCFFRINFVPSKKVQYQLSAADTVPTGCDTPAIEGLAPTQTP